MITGGAVSWAIAAVTTGNTSRSRVDVTMTCTPEGNDLKKITIVASFDSSKGLQEFIRQLQAAQSHVWKDLSTDL